MGEVPGLAGHHIGFYPFPISIADEMREEHRRRVLGQLRSLWPDPIAESELVFPPADLQYEEIKHHLGGIKPGESKPVPLSAD